MLLYKTRWNRRLGAGGRVWIVSGFVNSHHDIQRRCLKRRQTADDSLGGTHRRMNDKRERRNWHGWSNKRQVFHGIYDIDARASACRKFSSSVIRRRVLLLSLDFHNEWVVRRHSFGVIHLLCHVRTTIILRQPAMCCRWWPITTSGTVRHLENVSRFSTFPVYI